MADAVHPVLHWVGGTQPGCVERGLRTQCPDVWARLQPLARRDQPGQALGGGSPGSEQGLEAGGRGQQRE